MLYILEDFLLPASNRSGEILERYVGCFWMKAMCYQPSLDYQAKLCPSDIVISKRRAFKNILQAAQAVYRRALLERWEGIHYQLLSGLAELISFLFWSWTRCEQNIK